MMKRYLLFVVIFFNLNYADDQTWFAQANALYAQGAYEPALQAYEQITQKSPSAWYNMGNAAYQLNDYFNARLYWLRAQVHGDAQVFTASTKNLMHLSHKGVSEPMNRLLVWFWWFSRYISVYVWQLIFLILWYVLMFSIYKRLNMFYVRMLLLLILMIASMSMIVAYYYERPKAFIVQDTVMYNGPNSSYYELATVPKGSLVMRSNEQHNWHQISYNNTVGWVQDEHLALI